MKQFIFFIAAMFTFQSCGPSKQEIAAQQKLREQEIADSIAHVFEIQRIAAEKEKAFQDSISRLELESLKEVAVAALNDPSQLKKGLYKEEANNPLKYLSVSFDVEGTFSKNKARIYGKILNKATLVSFKDVVLRMNFYTKTNSFISKEDKSLYEYVRANSSKGFDWKIRTPNNTSLISVEVLKATVATN